MMSSKIELDEFGRTGLHHAVLEGKTSEVRRLLAQGYDANAKDKQGWTPLHFAAQEYQVEIAAILLEYGAKVDTQDEFGNTPLWRACFNSRGRGGLIQLLKQAGANPNLPNKHGVSPLDLAKTIGNFDVKQFFGSAE